LGSYRRCHPGQDPTRCCRSKRPNSRLLVANFTDTDKRVAQGTILGLLTMDAQENFVAIPQASSDKAFRKDLQAAVNSASKASRRAEEDLTPMYFDQLGKPPASPELNEEDIPKGLDLSNTVCTPSQLTSLKEIIRWHRGNFVDSGMRWPSIVRGFEFGIELLPDLEPVRHQHRRQAPGPAREKAVKETEAMIANGLVEPSNSEYAANVIMLAKKDGEPNSQKALIYVPESLRQSIMNVFHGLPLTGHLGFQKTWSLLRARFFWPRVKRDLTKWIQSCLCCQRRKSTRNKRHCMSSPIPRPGQPFEMIHFDLVGPLEESTRGNKYILTAICPFPFAIGVYSMYVSGTIV
jgi:hypothetical protein